MLLLSLASVLSTSVVAPRKPPQAPRSSQAATQAAASEPRPSTPLPAKRSKRTKAEPAAEPTKGKGKGMSKAAKAKPAPQPGRWLDRDCNAALNMQRIGESRWWPLELCYWPDQGALPAKGKEYPGLGYKRLRDKPPKAQQQQQVPSNRSCNKFEQELLGLEASVRALEKHVVQLKAHLQSERAVIPKVEALIAASKLQASDLHTITSHLPPHLPGLAGAVPQHLSKTNGDVKAPASSLPDSMQPLKTSTSSKACKPGERREPVPHWYITEAELASVSGYMKGRLTLDKINSAVDELAGYAEANIKLLATARTAGAKMAGPERKRATELLHSIANKDGIKGRHWLCEADFAKDGVHIRADKTGKCSHKQPAEQLDHNAVEGCSRGPRKVEDKLDKVTRSCPPAFQDDAFDLEQAWAQRMLYGHHPALCLAAVIDPNFRDKHGALLPDQMRSVEDLAARLASSNGQGDDSAAAQARDEFHTWCSDGYMVKMNLSPSIFHPRLLRDPVTWWEWYGKKTPVLQQVAQRVLSIPATSAGVERLFSVFKFIWSDRRNRLLKGRMWAMAYVYFNTRALRHLEEPMADDAADVARWEEWMASQPVEALAATMGGKRPSKTRRQSLQELNASPKAGFKCCPNGLKAQRNKAQVEAMKLRAQGEQLHQQLGDAVADYQLLQADMEQLQAAHQEVQGENESLEQLAEERTHAIQMLQQDKRRLSLALRNVRRCRVSGPRLTRHQRQLMNILMRHQVSPEVLQRCADLGPHSTWHQFSQDIQAMAEGSPCSTRLRLHLEVYFLACPTSNAPVESLLQLLKHGAGRFMELPALLEHMSLHTLRTTLNSVDVHDFTLQMPKLRTAVRLEEVAAASASAPARAARKATAAACCVGGVVVNVGDHASQQRVAAAAAAAGCSQVCRQVPGVPPPQPPLPPQPPPHQPPQQQGRSSWGTALEGQMLAPPIASPQGPIASPDLRHMYQLALAAIATQGQAAPAQGSELGAATPAPGFTLRKRTTPSEGLPKTAAKRKGGSGQQEDEGQGQGEQEVIAERRQVIKAAFRALVEAAQPDLSPAEVDAVVAQVNQRMAMGSMQCCLASVMLLTMLLQSFLGQPTPGFPAGGPAPCPPPPPDPACPPYSHPRLPTRRSPRSAAPPAQLPPPMQLDTEDPNLLPQIKAAMDLLTNASVKEHMMRGPHHRGIRLLPGEVAVFEQPSSAWPVAKLQELDQVHLQGDLDSLNANATKITTSIMEYYRHPQRFITWWAKAVGVVAGGFSKEARKHFPQLVLGRELTATNDYSPATHIAVGVDPGVTQAIKAAHAQRHPVTAAIQPQLQQLAAATTAGTTLGPTVGGVSPAWSLRHAKCVRGLKWCQEVPPNPPPPPPAQDPPPLAQDPPPPAPAQDPPPLAQDPPPPPAQAPQPPPQAPRGPLQRPQAPLWGRWLDRDTNPCLNFQRIGESKQRPLELCRWEGLALPPIGKEYQQRYKLVNDRLPKDRQRLHRAAAYRRGIDGRARNNA
ncbi:hypothetical protein QJQ45_003753 [Haematococcus lacustris]|nr:hypothetical protein QJQ45_003753 [Haematococcus lacustris]